MKRRRLLALGSLALLVLVALCSFLLLEAGRRPALLRSLGVAALAATTALLIGVSYALVVVRWRIPGRRLVAVLGAAPLIVPPYLAAISWVGVFGPAGFLPNLLGLRRPDGPSLLAESWVYSTPSCGLLLGGCLFPLVYLASFAALRRVPPEALDAARLARGRAGVRRLLLSAALPHALVGALAVFALGAVEFAVPQLLRVRVLAEFVFSTFDADHEPLRAVLTALPLLVLTALVALALVASTWRPPLRGAAALAPRTPSAGARGLGLAGCLLALAPGFLLPAAALAARLSPDVLAMALDVGASDARRSLIVGVLTATCGVALALALGYPLRRGARAPLIAIALALAIVVACPAPVVGIGILEAFNSERLGFFLESLMCVVLTCLIRFGPIAAVIVWVALRAVPAAEEEAARLADRDPLGRVVLPQVLPSLLVAWGLLYVLAVTEYGASALVNPPGQSVLSVFVVNEAHYGQGAELSGLCALLMAVVVAPLLPLGAAGWLLRRRRQA